MGLPRRHMHRRRLTFEAFERRELLDAAESLWRYPFDAPSASPAAFVDTGASWPQPGGLGTALTLTYSLSNLADGGLPGGLQPAQLRAAVEEVLALWASYAPLRFVEVVDSGPAPSEVVYGAAGHPQIRIGHHYIDGDVAPDELAHAYLPPDEIFNDGLSGDVHFDDGNTWSLDPDTAVDVLEVLVHELGHALGLGHEEFATAIMNPFYAGRYDGLGTSFLFPDDIAGIRGLYGSGVGSVTPIVEIGVFGNSMEIAAGDPIASLADGTYFGSVVVDSSAIVHEFTINNVGHGSLQLTGSPIVEISGPNAGDFSLTVQPSSTVPPLGNTTFAIGFSPTASGERTAIVRIANNDRDENPYEFVIGGRGLSPHQEIDLFGLGRPINTQDMTPSTFDGTDFGFVNVAGGAVVRTYMIRNAGALPLALTSIPKVELTGPHAADFAVMIAPATQVPSEGESNFSIRFDPTAIGVRSAVVRIASDDNDENPYEFAISGTGYAANAEIGVFGNGTPIVDGDTTPSVLDHTAFGAANVDGVILTRTFTISNTGVGPLHLTAVPLVMFSGAAAGDFSVVAEPTTPVPVGGNTIFSIAFNPTRAGTRTATVSIANSDANEDPFEFTISGIGFAAAAEIEVRGEGRIIAAGDNTPDVTDGTQFGNVAAGGVPSTRTFAIANVGSSALNLLGNPRVAITGLHAGDFRVVAWPESPVGIGGSSAFTIEFAPAGAGERTAAIHVASNDVDENPYSFSIAGFGEAPPHVVGVVVDSTAGPFAAHELETGSGRSQWRPMPWVNVNRIAIRFDQDVIVSAEDISVLAGDGLPMEPAPNGFHYDSELRTATWTFTTSFSAAMHTMRLRSYDGMTGVRTVDGVALDGEWADPAAYDNGASDTFPSGDGAAGGVFALTFRVDPGNAEQAILDNVDEALHVNWLDLRAVLDRMFRAASDAAYSKWTDLDGDGVINASDAVLANNYRKTEVSGAVASAAIAAVSDRESLRLAALRQRTSRRPNVPQPCPVNDMVTPKNIRIDDLGRVRQLGATRDGVAIAPNLGSTRRQH